MRAWTGSKDETAGPGREAPGSGRACPQSGSATVETALVLPLLLLLVFGAMEVANALSYWISIQKAADVGVRFASTGQGEIEGTRLTDIITKTNQFLASSRGAGASVTVRSWPGVNASGAGRQNNPGIPCDTVEVQVTYNYITVTPISALMGMFNASGWAAQIPMTAYARRINEPWQPCP
jgi:Flp pilus assembly protein TadG